MAKYQWVKGITSKIPDSENHYYMNDFDRYELPDVIKTLKKMKKWAKQQHNIDFNDITIMGGDIDYSFRCVSYTEMSFSQLIECIVRCDYIDPIWLKWVIIRREATIRLSEKANRDKPLKIVYTIKGKSSALPEKVNEASYRTVIR